MERTPDLTHAIAQAALKRESLRLRELVLELLRSHPDLSLIAPLENASDQERAVLAGILELLASRRGMVALSWTVGATNLEPFFLLAAAEVMPRLRELCESESPEPLRKRHLTVFVGASQFSRIRLRRQVKGTRNFRVPLEIACVDLYGAAKARSVEYFASTNP